MCEVRCGAQVWADVIQDDDGATVTVRQSWPERRLISRFVVGCDGVASTDSRDAKGTVAVLDDLLAR